MLFRSAGRVLRQRHAAAAGFRNPLRQHALFRGGTGDRPARLRRHGGAGQVPVAWRGDRMSPDTELPLWAAIVTAALVLLGASLALIGTVGLLRLKTFYERVHAPTLGTTLGI